MKIKVKLFGILAAQLGDQIVLDLPEKIEVTAIKEKVAGGDPTLKKWVAVSRVAFNQEFVTSKKIALKPKSEVAIIPPVSGG